MSAIAVYTTVATVDDARRLASALVERQLVACAQISAVESFYRWDGAVQNESEYRVLFKTLDAQYEAVEAAIRALHPYQLPAIWALPLERVYPPYGQWIADNACSGLEAR